jgi:hypothetical protein
LSPVAQGTGLDLIWERLARPYDPEAVIEAVLGLPHRIVRELVGAAIATSDEAEALLDAMPGTLRSLAIATTDQPARCYGEIRGPVMWAETVAARSASAGDPGLYVCSTTAKAFDTDENRVLVAALDNVRRAGRRVADLDDGSIDESVLRRARHNSDLALRYLEHRTLLDVPRSQRPSPRALHRTRSGTRKRSYLPALRMLERVREPFSKASLELFSDPRTTAQHDLVAAVIRALEARGYPLGPFHTNEGDLVAGPVRYRHARRSDRADTLHGILVGKVVLDVPEEGEPDRLAAARRLEQRSQGRPSVLVDMPEDIDSAVELALDLGLVPG